MASVQLNNLSKSYRKDELVVKDFNLDIQDGEFIVLVGPSGCGKSTVLRMIAGLEDITAGEIQIDGDIVNERPPKDRDIAMVFQNYALYPHMDVYNNLAFGLKLRKFSKDEINERVNSTASILEIQDYLKTKPKELSGGQRQRVALGRAIVRNPKVFLFDEPLSNLDAKLRVQMRAEIKKLHSELRTTMVYVTHDQVEAMTMGDRIVIMKDGIIQQIGSPMEVYQSPKNIFVGSFIGSPAMNFIPGSLSDGKFETEGLKLEIPGISKELQSKTISLGIRPEDIKIGQGSIDAEVLVTEPLGSETILHLNCCNQELIVKYPALVNFKYGQKIAIDFNSEKFILFDTVSGDRVTFD